MRTSSVACGIKGVLPYVRHVAPHCLVPVQLAELAHARIAMYVRSTHAATRRSSRSASFIATAPTPAATWPASAT